MKVTALKTPIVQSGDNLVELLFATVGQPPEKSVLVITSKIVALCQRRVVRIGSVTKADLIAKEADFFVPAEESRYGITLTITDGLLIPTAGIDESNGNGYFILWPCEVWSVARQIRQAFCDQYHVRDFGVVITDSKTTPLRRGTTGVAMACAGFQPLNNYVGKKDLFDRPLYVTQANVMDGLAAAAVLVMGEGKERTPLALVEEVGFVKFSEAAPTPAEREMLTIPIEEDLYAPLLQNEKWIAGRR
jgi:putative folate metabolism gamma-glutamate ligase